MQVTVQNGNKEVIISIIGKNEWAGGNNKRVYFELEQSNKRNVISKLYEIFEGSCQDEKIEVAGRVFGFQFGLSCDSKSKRVAAAEAVEQLVQKIVSA